MAVDLLAVLAGYLLGSLPTATTIGRRAGHDPIREGSGNPGATNVFRTAGRRAGALVLAADVSKGALAAGAGLLAGDNLLGLACGTAAVAGHVLPLGRLRHGGKGAATCAGVLAVLHPLPGLTLAAVWLLVATFSRRASVASIVLAAGLPVAGAAAGARGTELVVLRVLGAVVLARHAGNVVRLLRGTEAPVEAGRP